MNDENLRIYCDCVIGCKRCGRDPEDFALNVYETTITGGIQEMNERDFCYWLRGYFEMLDAQWQHRADDPAFDINTMTMNAGQVKLIKAHLSRVFGDQNSPATNWKVDPTIKNHLTC